MKQLNTMMHGKWWVLLLRGILAVLLGIIALVNLRATAMILYFFLGYYFIIEALLKFSQAWMVRKTGENLWPALLSGVVSLVVGILIFAWPRATVIVLIALVATHAIIQGLTDLYTTIRYRSELEKKWLWLTVLGGIAQLFFALWMIAQPVLGGLALIAVIGIYAMVIGVILILRAFQVRSGGSPGATASA